MQDLDSALRKHFGDARRGNRLAALGEAHALHEAGYEVFYSRYSVTYRDRVGSFDLAAEFDEDGVLHVRPVPSLDEDRRARILDALRFLGVAAKLR